MPNPTSGNINQPSSLDRFFWERGVKLFDLAGPKNGATIAFAINAVIHSILAMGFCIAAVANQNAEKAQRFWMISPIFIGLALTCGGLAFYFNRRNKRSNRSDIRLSVEGLRLVMKVFGHIGYNQNAHSNSMSWLTGSNSNHRPPAVQWLTDTFGIGRRRTASDVLLPESFQLLERAAHSYNRCNGVLNARGSTTPESLSRMRGSILQAADEAMVAIFNQLATLERMPESAPAITRQVERDLKALDELAQRVETIASQTPSFVESASSSSAMAGVLEQLRFDEAARAELLIPENDDNDRLRH